MPIFHDSKTQTFHLQSAASSYIIQLVESAHPAHLYWGPKLSQELFDKRIHSIERASFSPNLSPEAMHVSLDTLPQEYPAYGSGDFREPAFEARYADGSTVSRLAYKRHKIISGKPELEGLPATYVENDAEADTLQIHLRDELTGLRAELSYTVFHEIDAITRSVRFINEGQDVIALGRALSASVDFNHSEFDMLQLSGSWIRERHIHRRELVPGIQRIDSKRGASSHSQNPFIALLERNAGEDHGEVYGFSLVYSGSFLGQAEVEPFGTTRVQLGLQPFDFEWRLEAGEHFQTPEAVMVRSSEGLGGMSRTYHKLYRTRLIRGQFRDKARPVLVNNWEATYFDFNAGKIKEIAAAGQELGIELFVLDDGWFGKRDDDKTSLGDWFEDKRKLPEGLAQLVNEITETGMQFGLWFEPEMVSPDSELYRAHPDWCLHVPNRSRTEARRQLILDLSRADVCDYIVDSVSKVLESAPITYVKWDMNRNMTEIGSELLGSERQRETAHRYMLGLYSVLERIVTRFPHVLFESCSGGGGRFDPGMLHYMPQTWTSDDSDAVERLKIQYGTSMVYPASSMGAHVSAVPNHQVGRMTPLEMRGHVAMSGNFGYELDLTKFTEEEKTEVKAQVQQYKELRDLIQFGEFYRIKSPFEGNDTAWTYVSEDRSQAFAAYFQVLSEPYAPLRRLKLKGLDPNKRYTVEGRVGVGESGAVYGGDELMYMGLSLPMLHGDFQSVLYVIKEA
ncbi:alpha-galactosidase [Saccharibacillus kuerlensis]|uniref:Alpha-galactosidase n=1 Tax=Saccharibacillus kuerlensis TaxID=459527 RepID=A0ABQ2LA73_9BACL|nr:alpha-galactosidase [Saccharibacillus kuerlensis]GGO08275.1 alpha-galactosidase [Saccharibacillus kuerlensis]